MEHQHTPPDAQPELDLHSDDSAMRQHQHLRRILLAFLTVVVLLPLTALGGAWTWLLLPLLASAALALREAIRLRRSVRRYGIAPRRY